MHHVLRASEMKMEPAFARTSKAFRRCSLVDETVGSVHTALGLCELGHEGHIDTHLHSFEESFYILEGKPVLELDGPAHGLQPGACGVIPVGMKHAWRNPSGEHAKWIDMLSPLPRRGNKPPDTFFLGPPANCAALPLDIRDPRSRHLFLMQEDDIIVDKLKIGARVDAPAVSASMSTALLAYSGIALKMLVDQRLGCQLSTMFMIEYQPGGVAHLHDHPLEESYYILDGEVEAVGDDNCYTLRKGDLFWTGVGCIHAFYNTSNSTVRWLETQSPQLPPRYGYRFNRDWDYLREKLAGSSMDIGKSVDARKRPGMRKRKAH